MQVSQLLDHIESNAIVLPEFQREYVWRRPQAKELMASLYNGYPIGGLLLWETENPPEIKNDAIDREKHKLFQVLLDGQQRLTVLYLLLKDEIPPYYDEEEINYDPRDLYFNAATGEFHFENKLIQEAPEWVPVTDIFTESIKKVDIAKAKADGDAEAVLDLVETYEDTIDRLKKIEHHAIPLETLPKSADVHQAIELFDKINSQGTHLGEAELALAHMSAQWPHIRREMKAKQKDLRERGFGFGLTFYVKCMIAAVTGGMTYEHVYDTPEGELRGAWKKLARENGALDYVVNLLENEGHVPDSSYINTRDVLVPLVTFVYRNDNRMSQREKELFLHWFYAAMMWSRYGGSADTKIEHDLSLLDGEHPTQDLIQEIRDDRGRIEVQASDLRGRGKRSKRFYNMVRIITRANDPVDWKTGEPLKGAFKLESHHIFPKSILYGMYDSSNSNHTKLVNEISNRAFVTPRSNRELGDQPPSQYLPRIKEAHPNALESQLIPDNPPLWEADNYEEFLAKRRELLATGINDFMEGLREGEIEKPEETLRERIRKGETGRTEFKETLLYDVYRDQPNKALTTKAVKEIAALANSGGGVLIIGVDDETHEVRGLERDFKLMKKGRDSFEQRLTQEISNRLGTMFAAAYIHVEFREVDGKGVCVVSVEKPTDPMYFDGDDGQHFFVRAGTSSRALPIEEAKAYIDENWS